MKNNNNNKKTKTNNGFLRCHGAENEKCQLYVNLLSQTTLNKTIFGMTLYPVAAAMYRNSIAAVSNVSLTSFALSSKT